MIIDVEWYIYQFDLRVLKIAKLGYGYLFRKFHNICNQDVSGSKVLVQTVASSKLCT